MMRMLQITSSAGGKLDDPENAHKLLANTVAEEVLCALPKNFDTILALVVKARKQHITICDPKACELLKDDQGLEGLSALRLVIGSYITATLGMQQFLKQEGPSMTSKPFFSSLLIYLLNYNLFQPFVQKCSSSPLEVIYEVPMATDRITALCTLNTVLFTLNSALYTLNTVLCTLNTALCTLHTPH